MKLSELIAKLNVIKITADKLNIDPVVMMRNPGSFSFVPLKPTSTYVSQSIGGTTHYEQVPCLLFEEDKDAKS